jgi:hypothetical protein
MAERDDHCIDYHLPTQPEFGFPVYGGVFNAIEYITSLPTRNGSSDLGSHVRVHTGYIGTFRLIESNTNDHLLKKPSPTW